MRYHFTHVYHKWQSYDDWLLRYGAWQTKLLVILDHSLPFYNRQNQNFEKMKNTPGDIIILHKCTKNHDHMLHCSCDTTCEGCNFLFLILAYFLPFTLLTTQKTKIFTKWNKQLEISSFYACITKIMITWCMVPEIWCMTDGRTDRWKKWHIKVGAPANNNNKKEKHLTQLICD